MSASININAYMRYSKEGLTTRNLRALIVIASGMQKAHEIALSISSSKSWANSPVGIHRLINLGLIEREKITYRSGKSRYSNVRLTEKGKALFEMGGAV